jgi:hypothetical protein
VHKQLSRTIVSWWAERKGVRKDWCNDCHVTVCNICHSVTTRTHDDQACDTSSLLDLVPPPSPVGDALVEALESTFSPHSLSSPQLSPPSFGLGHHSFPPFSSSWDLAPLVSSTPLLTGGSKNPLFSAPLTPWADRPPCFTLILWKTPSLGASTPRLILWKTPSSGVSTPLLVMGKFSSVQFRAHIA